MYYIISMTYLPDELFKEIQKYMPDAGRGFLFIDSNDLSLHSSYLHLFHGETEPIDIKKLKEILLIKHLED